MADVVAAAAEPDELDDIDKVWTTAYKVINWTCFTTIHVYSFQVRDDLQSAKQMLALELRSKEALERENKRLLARVTNLQEELKDKSSTPGPTRSETDQQVHQYIRYILKNINDARVKKCFYKNLKKTMVFFFSSSIS